MLLRVVLLKQKIHSKYKNLNPQSNPDNYSKFCKTSLFSNLKQGSVQAINNYLGSNNLSELISGSSSTENQRLSNFSFEYFITYSPDKNGLTNSPKKNLN